VPVAGACADSNLRELHRLGSTIDSWREESLAYLDTGGVSNGPTEAMNLLTKKVKRTGHGSETSTTTGHGFSCTAASNGALNNQLECVEPLFLHLGPPRIVSTHHES
jgi:hypothetical protein